MFLNSLKLAIRKLLKNRAHSFINIAGLSVGMAVAILIGLWVKDELSFDTYHKNYASTAQVYRKEVTNGEAFIAEDNNQFPIPLAGALRTGYSQDFKAVALASFSDEHLLSVANHPLTSQGMYVEPAFTDIFTFRMIAGTKTLQEPNSILLSQSLARTLFGHDDATGKTLTMDNKQAVSVAGVFEDMPRNAKFSDVGFFCPFSLMVSTNDYMKTMVNDWGNSSFHLFVQAAPGVSMHQISARIGDVYWAKIKASQPAGSNYKASIFLHPMKDWHLRSNWTNGVQTGGRIQLVELFGIIGLFVLLLACINFMNLSTARAEKSAKEVGIRKAIGSLRSQLIRQFMTESLAVVCVAFVLSAALVSLSLGQFNQLADKEIHFPVADPAFWIVALLFILITAILAGSYPAFYLSSFQPVKVLKGVFRAGRGAAIPRRVMVVLQFTVSIALISGTIIVYRQVQYAQDRPAGYNKSGLISLKMNSNNLNGKYDALRHDLLQSRGAVDFAENSSPTTNIDYFDDRFEWPGKDPQLPHEAFGLMGVTRDFGKTVGWQFTSGRDFYTDFGTDDAAVILNETAVKYMGLTNAVGQTLKWNGRPFRIDGVIKDMITGSPYEPVQKGVFILTATVGPYMVIRLNPALSITEALSRIQPVFAKYDPVGTFDYRFVDEEYGHKFAAEQRIGVLTTVFSVLAILISCLGIFGLASFVAEQRTKEIGVRKILGASVIRLWGLLSREFVLLVLLALVIAVPLAVWFMKGWLAQYTYHTTMAWWIFGAAGAGTLLITLATVSYQSIKAALMNPVKSLRSE